MKKITYSQAADRLQTFGRTWYDRATDTLYTNFTCGGFRLRFSGSVLAVQFRAEPDTMVPPGAPVNAAQPSKEDWPFIAVFLDGAQEPQKKIRVRDGETVTVFLSEAPETHTIQIVKLTENFRTALGLAGFLTDGTLLPIEREQRDVIELIGDSITCGFGNGTSDPSHEFAAAEEDGWMTHGAIAARKLNLEPRFISVSGIATAGAPFPDFYAMRDLYPYSDRIIQEKLAAKRGKEAELEKYDFSAKPARFIVLNLGTNDASQIYFSPDKQRATEDFRSNYKAFVQEIRALNGPDAAIVCALGCMDYYLFDEICSIVDAIRKETGDRRLFTLKYNKMMLSGPDVGGCMHPSIYRQERMAEDLVSKLQALMQEGL